MANKALRFCSWPGCNELCKDRYCEKHQAAADDRRAAEKARYQRGRPSTAKQGYDAQWQKCRAAYLMKHPLCEMCQRDKKITPAVLVHHIRAIQDGGSRLDPSNLMALCNACHERIHGPDRWRRK